MSVRPSEGSHLYCSLSFLPFPPGSRVSQYSRVCLGAVRHLGVNLRSEGAPGGHSSHSMVALGVTFERPMECTRGVPRSPMEHSRGCQDVVFFQPLAIAAPFQIQNSTALSDLAMVVCL